MNRNVVMVILKVGVVCPPRNGRSGYRTIIACNLRFKVVCNSNYLHIGILLWQFQKWVWCLLPEMSEYIIM